MRLKDLPCVYEGVHRHDPDRRQAIPFLAMAQVKDEPDELEAEVKLAYLIAAQLRTALAEVEGFITETQGMLAIRDHNRQIVPDGAG